MTEAESSKPKEWTMKPSEMAGWVEQVTSQSLEVLHRFGELETASTTVLEIGAGRGTFSLRALERMPATAKLLLTDASEDMVAQMQQTLNQEDARVEIQHVNAVELPFKDNSMDTYLANLVLHHVSDSRKALQEAFRVLKTNGRLSLTEVDAEQSGTFFALPQQAMKSVNLDSGHAHQQNHAHQHEHQHHHGHDEKTENHVEDTHESTDNHLDNSAAHHHHHHHGNPALDDNSGHNHEHAMRHGGMEELRHMVQQAGFVNVVAWHLDCIAETHDANRFAQNWWQHQQSKHSGATAADKEQEYKAEVRRLAQMELDAGRPISFGTVILTANKPS